MHELSTDELTALGERFGIPIGADEASAVRDDANMFLRTLEGVAELPVPANDVELAGRSWSEPVDDPHNALAVTCEVTPAVGASGGLAGVTVGIKDVIAVAGVPMQCGSAVMQGYVPAFDAAVVDRILAAGGRIDAITNCDEFAGSARGTTPSDGPITNPHDPDRTAGGSSGGSAVAVATERVDVTLGTDTGGSIRIPAAFCGVVGLKPTYGLVPLHGVVENTYTQDHVGPLTRSVADAATILEAIAGPDSRDPASLQAAGRGRYAAGGYVDAVRDPPATGECRLGVVEAAMGDDVAPDVAEQTEAAIDRFADAGASIERVDVAGYDRGRAIKNALSVTELAAHWRAGGAPYRRGGNVDPAYQAALAERIGDRGGELGPFYKAKLLAGAHVIEALDGAPYTRAQAAREALREGFEDALTGVDGLVLPTTPDIAPRLEDTDGPAFDYARHTRAADVTRLPAVSLPNGTVDGLPVGLQIMAGAFEEAPLLATATTLEDRLPAPR